MESKQAVKAARTKVVEAEGHTDPKNARNESCFVIMPFGGWFDAYYEQIYSPAIEAAGLTPLRADNLFRPGVVIKEIWKMTNDAEIILADLSETNPNVFYELGLAHAIAKPAILVVDSINAVPFDLRHLRVIVYDKNEHNWGSKLHDAIKRSIGEVMANPKLSILNTFIETVPEITASATASEKAVIELSQELESLRRDINRLLSLATQAETSRQPTGLMSGYGPSSFGGGMFGTQSVPGVLGRAAADAEFRKIVKEEAIAAITGKPRTKVAAAEATPKTEEEKEDEK